MKMKSDLETQFDAENVGTASCTRRGQKDVSLLRLLNVIILIASVTSVFLCFHCLKIWTYNIKSCLTHAFNFLH